ncbi:hypothetical protein CHGG_01324 [Chaetomium globosum CBS 148.51]|uniref:Superoxide dismutase copper/zinc binding domain-containing protein n=1 Tax=Chaetomium globosum (strain ATCC 6205 / CBS 148.51 / DSM 1962 / NBRC 6347 / NRRL 1970) TaxID=306901 RepID=Q2HEN0_CHAGB|nr:uncharacterized protein CHGG_01324 [Chaetomium globosum CBS 148.51]EAQ93089.1 hypothetical protein CHGG_01324 [Chaetomium globosum CBS 148.51]
MQLISLFALLGAAAVAVGQVTGPNVTTGALGDAKEVRNNPVIGETWVSTFNSDAVRGTVKAVAHTVGINYTLDVTGLVVDKGPYKYHIHVRATPESGNCTETGGHLDSFNDKYTALNPIQLGYIGDRSIVFHDNTGARIACATLKKVEKDDDTCH